MGRDPKSGVTSATMLRESTDTFSMRRDLYQARMVFWLFISSLAVFFVACIIAYIMIIRAVKFPQYELAADFAYRPLDLPLSFWISTVLLLSTSWILHRAAHSIARERLAAFLRYCRWAIVLAVAFLAVQSVGLNSLLQEHYQYMDQMGLTRLYGICFAFSFIHALHVLGGVFFIGFIAVQGHRGRYDHERHWAVDHCAWYWHFLDVVWLAMLAVFVLTR
jgi:cytochrome c oxidase subunit 3